MDRIQKRFDELEATAQQVAESLGINVTHRSNGAWTMEQPRGTDPHIVDTTDRSIFEQWRISVLTLLEQIFGPSKTAYREFSEYPSLYLSTAQFFHCLMPIFRAAKADFEGGHLFDIRNLVHAEVFSDELEQAKYILDAGFKVPAAVIAGVVLETTLRRLCEDHGDIEPAIKLDRMNNDLAKVAVYNKIRADQIRAWAKIRNAAAHGHQEEFDEGDVKRMIDGIQDFVAALMS